MIKTFEKCSSMGTLVLLLLLNVLSSCNPTEISSNGGRGGMLYNNGSMTNMAFIYRDSPAILDEQAGSGEVTIRRSMDFIKPEFITDNTTLKGNCNFIDGLFLDAGVETGCTHSYASKSATQQLLPRNSNGTWMFEPGSNQFYQVNAQYHLNKGIEAFYKGLRKAYDRLHNQLSVTKPKSIPGYLINSKLYWFKAITPANDNYFRNTFLSSYALCNIERNASFSPAGPDLCFGKWDGHPNFLVVQDPSVIYHELGHALIAVMMNLRNGTQSGSSADYHLFRSNFGSLGYSESGALGEGISDYWTYVITKRTHIGEWALNTTARSSRPMSEDDPLHISSLNKSSEGRLSYPQYVLYDPNDPNIPIEDVHYAGQIVSHYLVALTEGLKSKCSLPSSSAHDDATGYVTLLLAETLSELGDLRARGYDNYGNAFPASWTYRFANLDEFSSLLWSQDINPPTYRRFFQVFAKNINKYISATSDGLCPAFDKNTSEKLLDDYGLLLFKTYNDNMNSTKEKNIFFTSTGNVCDPSNTCPTPLPAPTKVNENNRRKSVLVSKDLLSLAQVGVEDKIVTYYLFDDKETVQSMLDHLLFKGYPVNLSKDVAGTEYNNSNIAISPGEVVAVVPNLFNSSNSIMAGVQLLATDWDHVHITDITGTNGNFKPCVVDDVTTVDQGAVADGTETCGQRTGNNSLPVIPTLNKYRRNVKQTVTTSPLVTSFCKAGGTSPYCKEAVAPVCLVELEENGSARWVSQNEFRKKNGLSLQDKDCLGYGYTGNIEDFTFNPHECLVRVLPGASTAFYSKIDPQKSYVSTVRNGNPEQKFGPKNTIMLEVNKWVPPGTKFRCRLRARFSNCSDCYSAPTDTTLDDYIDSELNGHKPFKVINFDFEVND